MSPFAEKARQLRESTDPVYNCGQAVAVPFASVCGLPEKVLFDMSANLGGGMRMASVCGAVAASNLVLGLCGVQDPKDVKEMYRRVREAHEGVLDCASLLKINAERGGQKKPHCDAMVFELVDLTEEILRSRGKI